ncbi:MAG: hypothetical protein ACQEWU_07515 [Bacillota bacterium]
MADYNYLELTAYIKGVKHKGLGVLAEAIDALQGSVKVKDFDINDYQDVVQSEAYEQLYDGDSICFIDDSELPENTPGHYKKPVIEPIIIRGVDTRIYIPAMAKDKDKIKLYIHKAVRPVIEALFWDDLISMKTKEAMEYENFQNEKETILISCERKNKTIRLNLEPTAIS